MGASPTDLGASIYAEHTDEGVGNNTSNVSISSGLNNRSRKGEMSLPLRNHWDMLQERALL